MATYEASLRLTKQDIDSLPMFHLYVYPADDRRPPGTEAGEVTHIRHYRDVLGTARDLMDVEDVHTAYEQARSEYGLPALTLDQVREKIDAAAGRGSIKLRHDGTWEGEVPIARS